MRIGETFDTNRIFAEGFGRATCDQTTHVVAARIHGRIARARSALFIIDASNACGRVRGLPLAIRRRSTATVATHAATFVARAWRTHAAQTESAIAAIGVLPALRARSPHRTRQTEGITRHRRPIDDNGFQSETVDARIAATRRRIVLGERLHASTDGQVANATFAFRIGRAFDAQWITVRLNGFALHLRAELTVRAAIAGRSRACIRRRTRLAVFPVALFPLGTIRIDLAFIARLRNGITCKSTRAIGIRATPAAFQVAIQIDAKWRIATTRRTRGTTKLVRIARRTQCRVIAIIPGDATIVSRLIDQCSIALLANVQVREGRIAAQRVEKCGRREERKTRVAQFDDRRLVGRTLEVRERTNEIRHLERRVFANFNVENLERVKPRLLKRYLFGDPPNGKTNFGWTSQNRIGCGIRPVKRQTDRIVRVKPEVNGLVCKVRGYVVITAKSHPERRRRVIDEKITPARLARGQYGINEITVTLLQTGRIVVRQIQQRANDGFDTIGFVRLHERIHRPRIGRRIEQSEIRRRTHRNGGSRAETRALTRQRVTHPLRNRHRRCRYRSRAQHERRRDRSNKKTMV